MSQHDFDVADAAGSVFLTDLNLSLKALGSLSSGSSAPSTTYSYQWWLDTGNSVLKMRNGANSAWVTMPMNIVTGLVALAGLDTSMVVTASETIASNNNDTTLPTSAAVKAYVDVPRAFADLAAALVVTASETIASNNNDTSLPTSAAVKAYADSVSSAANPIISASEPGTMYSGLMWQDTSVTPNLIKVRDTGNNHWIDFYKLHDASASAENPDLLLGSGTTFPAGHVVYTQSVKHTSTGASSDPDTTWTDTSLLITVPSAEVAKLSKILISVTNSCMITADAHGMAEFRIIRTSPSPNTVLAWIGVGIDGSYHPKPNVSIMGEDSSLETGDHVYKYQFTSSASVHSQLIYYHHAAGKLGMIHAMGIT